MSALLASRRGSIQNTRPKQRAMSLHCIQIPVELLEAKPTSNWKEGYEFSKEIGRGHFAKVWHVRCRQSNAHLAAKVIRRRRGGEDKIETIRREVCILRKMQTSVSSIVKIIDVHETKVEVGVILEYAHGGCLWRVCEDIPGGLPESYVAQAIRQVLLAVEALHDIAVVHLDIKADNILLRSPYPSCDIALCDFGVAVFLDGNKVQRELVGTPDYCAPEIINFEQISLSTDMWCIGVTAYYLLTRVSPFMGATKEETFVNISEMNLSFCSDLFANISPEAIQFIKSLVIKKSQDRLSAKQSLEHPWLSSTPLPHTFSSSNLANSKSIANSPDSVDSGIREEDENEDGEECGLSMLEMLG